jgi:hypothetical protein
LTINVRWYKGQDLQWIDSKNCYQLSSTGDMREPNGQEAAKQSSDSWVFIEQVEK